DASRLRLDPALEPQRRDHGAACLYPQLGWPVHCPDPGRQGLSVIFTETPLCGAFVIEPELIEDPRGFFARTWCRRQFELRGLETRMAQCSTSFNKRKGTLRGMHYQVAPCTETKIVRCTRGAMYDVIIDLRTGSPTRTRHFWIVLTADNRKMLYVPAGFAHG